MGRLDDGDAVGAPPGVQGRAEGHLADGIATKNVPLAPNNPPPRPVVTLLPSPRRRGPVLETLTDVRREMARVYRNMRHGRIDTQDATRMTYVLTQIAKIIQTAELEARIERLEAAADTTARP